MRQLEYKHSHKTKEAIRIGTIQSNTYDKLSNITPESSMYYALMVEKLGKQMADYYWDRRLKLEQGFDMDLKGDIINWEKECKDISNKCEVFLKSRGVDIWKGGDFKY